METKIVRYDINEPEILAAAAKACQAKGGMKLGTYARMVFVERLIADGYLYQTQTETAR